MHKRTRAHAGAASFGRVRVVGSYQELQRLLAAAKVRARARTHTRTHTHTRVHI